MIEIKLSNGLFTKISDEDYELVSGYNWHAAKYYRKLEDRYGFYVVARKNRRRLFMHRMITGAEQGFVVDHKNRDTLDNQRENLRVCTVAENLWNQQRPAKTSSSKGVYKVSTRFLRKPWHAQIAQGGVRKFLGRYATEIEASAAFQRAVLEMRGPEYLALDAANAKGLV